MTVDDPLDGGPLTSRHNDLARLLAGGLSWKAAGETLGISESTVSRMMRDEGMRGLVNMWRQRTVDGVLASLVPEALKSITYLAEVRDDPEASTGLRVQAARELLQSVARLGRHPAMNEPTAEQAKSLVDSVMRRIVEERGTP